MAMIGLGSSGVLAQFNSINPAPAAGGLDRRSDELLGQGFESQGFFSSLLLSCTPYRNIKNWFPSSSSVDRSHTSESAIDQPVGSFHA